MILIIGGAYQGKLDYALENYGGSVFQCTDTTVRLDLSADIISSFHLLILAQQRAGIDTQAYIAENLGALKSKVIVSDDVSCGVVPVDAELRQWRENVGRCHVQLAQCADEVVRVFCGLGMRLK